MLALLCPKVIVNIAIPFLMDASTLAQHLGILNTLFWHIAQFALVIATVTGWLAHQLHYSIVWSNALWVMTLLCACSDLYNSRDALQSYERY